MNKEVIMTGPDSDGYSEWTCPKCGFNYNLIDRDAQYDEDEDVIRLCVKCMENIVIFSLETPLQKLAKKYE